MTGDLRDPGRLPRGVGLQRLVDQVLQFWPDHRRFIERAERQMAASAIRLELGESVLALAGSRVEALIAGYRWMCEMMLEEELHFRRTGKYRHASFAEVDQAVYQDADLMQRYMDGLLLSQALWPNHVRIFEFYAGEYLPSVAHAKRHLEVGPGHGLLLHFAAQSINAELEAWDVSAHSLERTKQCLEVLGSSRRVAFRLQDVLGPAPVDSALFDSIVASEVLEHLENPALALSRLSQCLSPGGKIFINVPVNSPSIDHIALFETPEQVVELVRNTGLTVEKTCFAAAAGESEDFARRKRTTISCAVIASARN